MIAAVARERRRRRATVVQSGGEAVEVTAVGVNKAAALAEVAAEHGIEQADVDRVRRLPERRADARLGGARRRRRERSRRRCSTVADEVTASNDDDGVAIVLERLAV